MSKHRRTAIKGAPLTATELSGIEFPFVDKGRIITCCECGLAGGTLVREKDEQGNHTGRYKCQDQKKCQILAGRKDGVLKVRKGGKDGRKHEAGNTKAVPRAGRARQGGKGGR